MAHRCDEAVLVVDQFLQPPLCCPNLCDIEQCHDDTAQVEVTIDGSHVTVKGPTGTLEQTFSNVVGFDLDDGVVSVTRIDDEPGCCNGVDSGRSRT